VSPALLERKIIVPLPKLHVYQFRADPTSTKALAMDEESLRR
jgi:hypothetical protein